MGGEELLVRLPNTVARWGGLEQAAFGGLERAPIIEVGRRLTGRPGRDRVRTLLRMQRVLKKQIRAL